MNSESGQQEEQKLLENNSVNLSLQQNPEGFSPARNNLEGESAPIPKNEDSNDQKISVPGLEPDQLAQPEKGDSPLAQYESPQGNVEEDDGKLLQEESDEKDDEEEEDDKEEEGDHSANQNQNQDQTNMAPETPQEVETADLVLQTKKDHEKTRGLIPVKPAPPRKQKRFATIRSFYSKVAKLRSMSSFWAKEANVNIKKEMRDHYVNVADLLPEGIESAAELEKLYEDKRSMKKIRHLSSFPKAHEEEVFSLIFSPDHKYIISGSKDRTIKIWDVNTKRQLHHFKDAHEDGVRKLRMTSDSKYLISGSLDNTVKMWDFATRQLVHHFKGIHTERVSALAITSDNKFMITGSWDRSIKIFDLNTKEQIAHLEDAHTDVIRAVELTADNKYIISASGDGTVKLFDFHERKHVFTFEAHRREIYTMILTPDDKYIITGSQDKNVKIFVLRPGRKFIAGMKEFKTTLVRSR